MAVHDVAQAGMQRWDHQRLAALVGYPEMRHERLVEDRVDELAVIAPALALSDQADPLGGGPRVPGGLRWHHPMMTERGRCVRPGAPMPHDGRVAGTGTIAPARLCAYTVLRRVFEDGAYADQALHSQAKGLDPRDRALAMRLLYGAVQRRGTLDHFIGQLAGRPPSELDGHVLAALRLGLYELLYLRGAPDYAVVGDAVELAKANGRGGHGLVNAVLRRAAREGAPALLGDPRR